MLSQGTLFDITHSSAGITYSGTPVFVRNLAKLLDIEQFNAYLGPLISANGMVTLSQALHPRGFCSPTSPGKL